MKCKFCGAECYRQENLPTEEHGTYWFTCGTWRDDEGEWWQTINCKDAAPEPQGVKK